MEVRVPTLGTSFGALAASVRPEGVFLSTFVQLDVGTGVIATLSLPDGPAVVDGTVVDQNDPAGMGLAVEFRDLEAGMGARLSSASSLAPPAPLAAQVA